VLGQPAQQRLGGAAVCVGFAPKPANARRQAAIDGNPAGGVAASRSATSSWAVR
jgi:hypothetical protein